MVREKIDSFITYNRRHPLVALLVVVTLLLGSAYVIRRLTPKTADLASIPQPNLGPLISPSFTEAKVVLPEKLPNLPDSLPIYSARPMDISVDQLSALFELEKTEYPNRFTNTSKRRTLIFDPSSERYEYSDTAIDGDADPAFGTRIEPDKAVGLATNFVHNTLKLSSFSPIKSEISYYSKGDIEANIIDAKDANMAEIPFTVLLENNPSFGGRQLAYPLYIYVDSADKVFGFRMDQRLFTSSEPKTVTTISPEEIVDLLKKGQADILKLYSDETENFKLSNITNVEIQTVKVEYRYVPKSQMTVPFFHCIAQITLRTSKSLRAEFLVPAVRISSN